MDLRRSVWHRIVFEGALESRSNSKSIEIMVPGQVPLFGIFSESVLTILIKTRYAFAVRFLGYIVSWY